MVHLQGESFVKPGTFLLMMLSLVCKTDIKEVHGSLSNPISEKIVHGQKHPSPFDNTVFFVYLHQMIDINTLP